MPITGETMIMRRPFDRVLQWTKPDASIPSLVPEDDPEAQDFLPWTPAEEQFLLGTEKEPEVKPSLPKRKKSS